MVGRIVKWIMVLALMASAAWALDLAAPLEEYEVSSGHGLRRDPMGGALDKFHNGVDLIGPAASPVFAAADGKVIEIYQPSPGHPVYGGMVRLLHEDGSSTLYGHLSRVDVWLDWQCWQGRQIGVQGSTGISTGEHLHFEHNTPPTWKDPPPKLSPLESAIAGMVLAHKAHRFETWNIPRE